MQSGSNGNTVPAASPAPPTMSVATIGNRQVNGGRFDFDDGGTYCGGWEDGKAHGHGVCTGPKGQGEYSGSWHYGFEVSGVYTWPSGSTYEGHWQNGKRHGLGLELRGRWLYRGEWTQGFKGRYGVRQSTTSTAKYEGTWANGLQDGYGSETYADGGTYQGQWLRGMRHGYGVRTSAAFGMASHYKPKSSLRASLSSLRSDPPGVAADPAAERDKRLDDGRGGFVLKAKSDEAPVRRRSFSERSSNIKKSILQGLKLKKQHSTGELEKRGTSASIRSTGSSASWMSTESSQSGFTHGSHHTDSNASFVVEDDQLDASVTETYMGEWKNDKRAGFGISERSDGLKYEGEWFNNKKYGYGVTTFKDGTKEEGKYKNNVLITSQKKKHLFLIRSAKFRERIDAAVSAAQRASKIALQKADIAISRTATARGKAEQADVASLHSREDSEIARLIAKQLAPDFHQPDALKAQLAGRGALADISRLTLPLSQPKNEANGANNRNKSLYAQHSRDLESVLGSEPSTPENVLGETLRANESSLNRRPSVALGGVRSPNVTDATANGRPAHPSYSSPNSNMAYPYNSTPKTQPDLPNNTMHSAAAMRPSMNAMYDSRDDTDHMRGMNLAQESMPSGSSASSVNSTLERGRSSLRRGPTISFRDNSYSQPSHHPAANFQQAMNDHFDHYKRPPSRDRSRDSSIDRFSRSSRQSLARQIGPSVGPQPSMGFSHREQSLSRGQSPAPATFATQQRSASRQRTPFHLNPSTALPARTPDSGLSESLDNSEESPSSTVGKEFGGGHRRTMSRDLTNAPGNGSIPGLFPVGGMASNPVEEMLVRQRLGQEIPATANLPKRTESLYLSPAKRQASKLGDGSFSNLSLNMDWNAWEDEEEPSYATMEMLARRASCSILPDPPPALAAPAPPPPRKKSLPDSQAAAAAAAAAAALLSREEASVLSSQRREEIRRYMEEQERYRANPLLYVFNPQVKAWLVRKQFTIIILLLNLSLAYMFFKLLT